MPASYVHEFVNLKVIDPLDGRGTLPVPAATVCATELLNVPFRNGGDGVATQVTSEIAIVDAPDTRSPDASTVSNHGSFPFWRTRYSMVAGAELTTGTRSGSPVGITIAAGATAKSSR